MLCNKGLKCQLVGFLLPIYISTFQSYTIMLLREESTIFLFDRVKGEVLCKKKSFFLGPFIGNFCGDFLEELAVERRVKKRRIRREVLLFFFSPHLHLSFYGIKPSSLLPCLASALHHFASLLSLHTYCPIQVESRGGNKQGQPSTILQGRKGGEKEVLHEGHFHRPIF